MCPNFQFLITTTFACVVICIDFCYVVGNCVAQPLSNIFLTAKSHLTAKNNRNGRLQKDSNGFPNKSPKAIDLTARSLFCLFVCFYFIIARLTTFF